MRSVVNRRFAVLLTTLLTLILGACRSVENYNDPAGPLFQGNYSQGEPDFDGSLTVATWNIAFSEEIERAIEELAVSDELVGADILLLQEMDEVGVKAIAQAMGLNYIYYPASVHTKHDKNFGNAILSRWPLSDPAKLILPHNNPRNNQIRIASRAVADIDGTLVPVYSVHTETYWLGGEERKDQLDAVIDDLDAEDGYVIIGGDFNTLTPGSVGDLEDRFAAADLQRSTVGVGPSIGVSGIGLTLDQIFTRGFEVLEAGVLEDSEPSDHHPLWVRLSFDS